MKSSALQQFTELREELLKQREELQSRLEAINEALGASSTTNVPAPVRTPRGTRMAFPGLKKSTGRRGNARSLKEMVLDVTKAEPKTKHEILAAVQAAGYKFLTKDPLNSLSTLLYTAPEIQKEGDKFGPVSAALKMA
ncbi:MAG TPA: hypothetical protein VMF06_21990 [Candidatus Limnocylindria bacterium]|nr:hypothetical protein [Candidatus Limnocylindria bacterium]